MLAGDEGAAHQLAIRLVLKAADIMGADDLVPHRLCPSRCLFLCRRGACRFRAVSCSSMARNSPCRPGPMPMSSAAADPDFRPVREIAGNRQGRASPDATSTKRSAPSPPGPAPPITCPGGRDLAITSLRANPMPSPSTIRSLVRAPTNMATISTSPARIIGKAPFAGLHTDAGRKADILFRTAMSIPSCGSANRSSSICSAIIWAGSPGRRIPVIEGLPASAAEDDLQAP